jgi:hypothetical protein
MTFVTGPMAAARAAHRTMFRFSSEDSLLKAVVAFVTAFSAF